MDSMLCEGSDGKWWTGLVIAQQGALSTVAHQQMVLWGGPAIEEDRKVAVYDARVVRGEVHYMLNFDMYTKVVYLPADEETDMMTFKEVTCGIGGIGYAGKFLGMRCLAMLDVNGMVCQALEANGHLDIIQGDISDAQVRHQVHQCHDATRGWIFSGFPCQPLSTQGDMLGAQDHRADVFKNVVKLAWEQQAGGLLLECVPSALQAPYIQHELQRLGWSLNMEIKQRLLHLHAIWPCRRSRWWALMIPIKYQLYDIGNLPSAEPFPDMNHIFARWPIWSDEVEAELQLSEDELTMFSNKIYGCDERHLRIDRPAPCILHSYGSVLRECPCGCRSKFSLRRLQRDGIRGYYVIGCNGKERYLHVAEAAYLCTLPPSMVFPHGPRDSLCLVGQCAAPLQALWMLGNFMEHIGNNVHGTALIALQNYQTYLFRDAHGVFAFENLKHATLLQSHLDEAPLSLLVAPGQKVEDLIHAEHKWQAPGHVLHLQDELGNLPVHHLIQRASIAGQYHMVNRPKKQRKTMKAENIRISFLQIDGEEFTIKEGFFSAGTFVFEAARSLNIDGSDHRLQDEHGNRVDLDSRIWENVMLMRPSLLQAEGEQTAGLPVGGLTDLCLDMAANILIMTAQKQRTHYWMPAALATEWCLHPDADVHFAHWALAALHGKLYMAIAHDIHWMLLECSHQHGVLHLRHMDGQEHSSKVDVLSFARRIGHLLSISPCCVTKVQIFVQHSSQTCGTLVILHLGECLKLWTERNHPDEIQLHMNLVKNFPLGTILAFGKGMGQEDNDFIWPLRDILKARGVPEHRTEERARAAMDKIGKMKLKEALEARNPWQALKALGSMPKINFMFVKADELEVQIRQKAQSKFKVQASDKKTKVVKQKLEASDVAPDQLKMIDGTFALDNGGEVKQLAMHEVAAHRAGIAFAQVAEVMPFLREGKSISLDGLAVLTTSRIPPSEQGLLPVLNLRYPALYIPTQEPVLLEGSLVNLGDLTVIRKQEMEVIETPAIETGVLKLAQYRDEWPDSWETLIKAPLRTILQKHPAFTLCTGQKCGPGCAKYHAPVDVELDSVILDVWARAWMTLRGKKVASEDAEIFHVLLRVPMTLMKPLQRLSGTMGLYIEPRQTEGKGADTGSTVVWIQNGSLPEAIHKLKITEHGIAVARFGSRYGVRVPTKDAEMIHTQLNPEIPFANFEVNKIYELRPLPHGTQKLGVLSMLKAWGWKARPLQPCKADSLGMGWLIGAPNEPPAMIMATNTGDVMISLHRAHDGGDGGATLTSSAKTQGHLRRQQKDLKGESQQTKSKAASASSYAGHAEPDPWSQHDPWQSWRGNKGDTAMEDEPMHAKAMVDSMEERVTQTVLSTTEERFQRLEVDLAEIKNQNQKHEQWFHDAGNATQRLQNQVGTLTTQMGQQQQDVATLSQEIKSGFQLMESLLSKRQKVDD